MWLKFPFNCSGIVFISLKVRVRKLYVVFLSTSKACTLTQLMDRIGDGQMSYVCITKVPRMEAVPGVL